MGFSGPVGFAPVNTLWSLMLTLHLLAMAFFVGGQLFLVAAVVPVVRQTGDGERMRAIARRFGYGAGVSFLVSFATGAALASHYGLWSRHALQIKLGLIVVVVGLLGLHARRPRNHVLDAAILVCSLVIVYLGVRVAG